MADNITINTSTVNETLTIHLDGRIDSSNAPDAEQEIMSVAGANSDKKLEIDADKLEYISSAGLRVLMKLRKAVGTELTVHNVSSEVYDIFETTGFTELFNVHKSLREIDITGCPVIGQGGNGTIYRLDEDTIVKVYKPWMELKEIDSERNYARTAFVNGIPSVIAYDVVKAGDCLGVVFEMLKSDTLGHAMRDNPDKIPEYVDKYVELAKTLHSTHVPSGSFERIQDICHRRVRNLTKWCTKEEIDLLDSIIDEIPDADTVIHNDLHPGNIMLQDGELVLIDMQDVTVGPPICDMISIYRDMIAGPAGAESGSLEQTVGMNKDMIMNVGNMFFMKYIGIQDQTELKGYYEKLGLLFAFNVALVCGSGAENAMRLAPVIMDKLLRGVVIPNEQAIRQLFRIL